MGQLSFRMTEMAVKPFTSATKAMCFGLETEFAPAWRTAGGLEICHAAFVSPAG